MGCFYGRRTGDGRMESKCPIADSRERELGRYRGETAEVGIPLRAFRSLVRRGDNVVSSEN